MIISENSKGCGEELVTTWLKVLLQHFSGGTEQKHTRMAGLWAKIWFWGLSDMQLEFYHPADDALHIYITNKWKHRNN